MDVAWPFEHQVRSGVCLRRSETRSGRVPDHGRTAPVCNSAAIEACAMFRLGREGGRLGQRDSFIYPQARSTSSPKHPV